MTRIEKLERAVRGLSAKELAAFRKWFADFDAAEWDEQIREDIANGRIDRLAEPAIIEHASGQTRGL